MSQEADPNAPIYSVWVGGYQIIDGCTSAQADDIVETLWQHHKANMARHAAQLANKNEPPSS